MFYLDFVIIYTNVYLLFKGKVHSTIYFLSFSQPNISLWNVYAVFPHTVRMRATKKEQLYACIYIYT